MTKVAPLSLEQRIAAILNNVNAGAAELSELVSEVEGAVTAADQSIATLREKAADLVAAPDATAAFDAVQLAEHGRDRLLAALPKLRQRLTAALAAERHDRWLAEYDKTIPEHDAIKGKIAEVYPRILDELDGLDDLIMDYNAKAERINDDASGLNNEHRRLPMLSLGSTEADRRWGPPRVVNNGLAVALASGMSPSAPHPADRWWDSTHPVVAAQRQALEREREDIARHHERAAKEQEERENREERQRFAQQQRRG